MRRERICSEESCGGAAVAALAAKDVCLDHFLNQCYEQLSKLDPRNEGGQVSAFDPARLRAFVEECSRLALNVSLHCENLDNLQRARLLDILLWAGDLFVLLRRPPFCFQKGLFSEQEVIGQPLPARVASR